MFKNKRDTCFREFVNENIIRDIKRVFFSDFLKEGLESGT